MQNKCKKFRLWSILLLVMLMAAGFTCHSTSRDVQAATKNGFRTVKGKTYYYKNGKKVKGWLTLNGDRKSTRLNSSHPSSSRMPSSA